MSSDLPETARQTVEMMRRTGDNLTHITAALAKLFDGCGPTEELNQICLALYRQADSLEAAAKSTSSGPPEPSQN